MAKKTVEFTLNEETLLEAIEYIKLNIEDPEYAKKHTKEIKEIDETTKKEKITYVFDPDIESYIRHILIVAAVKNREQKAINKATKKAIDELDISDLDSEEG